MTCECCHCCFCCCEQNYDPNPTEPKKPKIEPKSTPIPKPQPPPEPLTPEPIWFDIGPSVPTIDEYYRPPVTKEDDFSFPKRSTPFEDGGPTEEEPPPPPPPSVTIPLTPTYSVTDYSGAERIDKATDVSQAVPSVTNQGPDPGWIGTTWDGGWGDWDGTPISIDGLTPSQICPLLFKNGFTMKGLRQLYYNTMPFADETAPTVAEIDAWNIEVIRHLRRLVGNTTPLEGDPRLYLEAQWADERRFTRLWDVEYPGTNCSAYGPCVPPCSNQHCGATFVPSFEDQAPYLTQYPGLEPFNFITGGAEGIGAVNTDVPWALKIVQRISNWVCTEGTGGHAGPLFNRTRVGMSFYTAVDASGNAAASTTLRMKWLG